MRLAHRTLGRSKPKNSWQYLTVSMLLVLNSFIKNLLMTKSKACKLDLVKGQASNLLGQ